MSEIITIFPGLAEKQYFQNPETQEFWFHATAACKSLGFDNPSRALMMYTDEDERFKEVHEGRETWFVSESGFYGLAFASKKPEAKAFKRWLKHDVLPKLRSQGLYVMKQSGESLAEYQEREAALLAENERLLERCHDYEYRQMLFRELPLVRYLKGITYRLTIKEAYHLAQVIMEGKREVYELDWQRLTWKQLNDIWHRHEDKEVYRKYLNLFHEHGIKPLSK